MLLIIKVQINWEISVCHFCCLKYVLLNPGAAINPVIWTIK